MAKSLPMREWKVPVRVVLQGYATIMASSADVAIAMVERGDFEVDPSAEMSDWTVRGKAVPA